ncbi:MAG TPA: MerR family transcriptional regulator [Ktedonobacteraceae bacterium]|jgi:DNA-binding transcriptional MerR regulator|nr:MerR family transcriptional regulator [Ktedonobacteraceae bacterium]
MQEEELTIEELAERVGVPVRTIRFYITEGLIPGPERRGKATAYGDEQLLRLRLVRRLSDRRVALAEIRAILTPLSLDEVRTLLEEEEQRVAEQERAAQAPSPKEYVSSLLKGAAHQLAERRAEYPAPASHSIAPEQSAPQHEDWQRWVLAPGIELHVSANVSQRDRALIGRLLKAAREYTNHPMLDDNA